MGRPLNKKYFGNKNSPYTDFQGITNPDSGLGGSVASVTVSGTNTLYTAVAALSIGAPTLVGGVQAVARAHMEVSSVVNFLAGTGYTQGDVLTLVEPGDVAITRATLTVTAVTAGGVIDTVSITTRGDYTTLPADVSRYSVTGGTGTLADFNLTFRVKNVEVTTAGSGYTSAPTVTDAGNADFTATLSVINGARAIKAFAYLTGGSRLAADIIKQDNKIQYKVENATGIEVVQLVDSQANAAGEMDITATDSAGNAYWVKKLTARKAVLTRKVSGNGQFASGTSVPWTLNAATVNYSVKIDNA